MDPRGSRWGPDPFTTSNTAAGQRELAGQREVYGSYNYASQPSQYASQPSQYASQGAQYRDGAYSNTLQRSWNDSVLPSRSLYSAEPSPGLYSSMPAEVAGNSQVTSLQYDLNQATAQRDELQNYVGKLTEALKKSEAENEAHRKAREETNVMFSYLQDNAGVKASSGKTDQMVEDLQKANSDRQQLRMRVNELEEQVLLNVKTRETLEETLQATSLECDALRKRMKDYENHGAIREVEMVEHKHLVESLRKQREELLKKNEELQKISQEKAGLDAAMEVMAQNPTLKQIHKLQLQLDAAKKEAKSAHAQLIKMRAELQTVRENGGNTNGTFIGSANESVNGDVEETPQKRAIPVMDAAPVAAAPPAPPPAPKPECAVCGVQCAACGVSNLASISPTIATRGAAMPPPPADVPKPVAEPKPADVPKPVAELKVAEVPKPVHVPRPEPKVVEVEVEKIVEKIVMKNIYIEPQLPRAPYISRRALNPLQMTMASPIAVTPPQPKPTPAPKAVAPGVAPPKPAVPPEQLKAAVDRVTQTQARVEQLRLKLQMAPKASAFTNAQPDVVTVTVHAASNLPKMDFFGSIDPFCAVKVGSDEKKTSVVKKNRNPTFGDTFEFKNPQGASAVIVTLYDWERMHDNRPIGVVSIPMVQLQAASVDAQDLSLSSVQAGKGMVLGKGSKPSTVKLSVRYTRGVPAAAAAGTDTRAQDEAALKAATKEYQQADAEYRALAEKAGADAGGVALPPAPAQIKVGAEDEGPWTLKLQLVQADHLPQMDVGGKADPYVIFKFGKQEFKSKTIKNTYNPQWGQEFIFEVTDESQSIEMTLMDWDRMSKDDVIGHVKLPVAQFSGKAHAGNFPVTKPNSTKRLIGHDGQEAEVTLVLTPSNAVEVRVETQDGGSAAGAAGGSVQGQGGGSSGPVRVIRHTVQPDANSPMTLSIKLNRELEMEANTPEKKEAFCNAFRGSVARALACPEDRLFVLNLQPGSIIVDLSFLPDLENPGAPPPQKLASEFMMQMVTPGSPLLQASATQGLMSCTVLDRVGQLEAENQFLLDHNNILQQVVKLSKITSNEKAKNIAKRLMLRGVHFCWNKWVDAVEQGFIEREKQAMQEEMDRVKGEKDGLLKQADRTVDILQEQMDKQNAEVEEHKNKQDALLEKKHELEREMLSRIRKLKETGGGPQLKMVLKSASHLPKVDTFGWIDAYCTCMVRSTHDADSDEPHIHKTSIKKKKENPEWDEEAKFPVDNPSAKFELTLYDWERVNDDRPIGFLEVPIERLAGKDEGMKEYPLMKADRTGPLTNQNGEPSKITLHLTFSPGDAEAAADMAELAELDRKLQEEKLLEQEARDRLRAAQGELWCRPPFNVRVTIKGCRHLPKTDTFGKCDPYCVVSLGSDERKTNRVEKTYDPDFNEELDFSVKRPGTLSVSVFDWDRGKSDDLVGTVDIPVGKLKPEAVDISVPLLAAGKQTHLRGHDGQEAILLLSLMPLIPDDVDEDAPNAIARPEAHHEGAQPWKLVVEGLEVHHLPKMDFMGKCDPYVMVAFCGDRMQTKPVKKVYDATWSDVFEFVVHSKEESLHMTVMDWDAGMQDDLVGNITIELKEYIESLQTASAEAVALTLPVQNNGMPVTGKDGKPCELTLKLRNKGEVDELDEALTAEGDPEAGNTGFLTVKVIKANGLPKMDSVSKKADPFLELTVPDPQQKPVTERTVTKWRTLEPEYNQEFEFECIIGQGSLFVEMFDDERVGKSRSMGSFTVPVVSRPQDLRRGLEGFIGKKKTPCCGHVYLETSWSKDKKGLGHDSLSLLEDDTKGARIEVTVKSVNNLPKMDQVGKCDPYVVMSIEEEPHKTLAAKSVYDYTYKDSEKPLGCWEKKSRSSTLEVIIYDHDKFGRDEQVGHVDVDLSKFKRDVHTSKTFEVLAPDRTPLFGYSKKRTTITLEIHILGGNDAGDSDIEDAEGEQCEVLVTAIRFGHFPKMDTFGSCDPYLILEMAEKEFKTKVVKNQYDGKWEEQFRFPLRGLAGKLRVKAFDYDGVGQDEIIGTVEIKVHDLFKTSDEATGTYGIKDKSKKLVKNKKTGQESFIELAFAKQKIKETMLKVVTDEVSSFCRDILKHRGSSCKLECEITSASFIAHAGTYFVAISVIRADGKTDKTPEKTKTVPSSHSPVWKQALLLDCEPEFMLYPESAATLKIELIDFRNSYSEVPVGVIKLSLVDVMFGGIQADLELPIRDVKHDTHILENARGFQSKLKLSFKPPKFLLEHSASHGLDLDRDAEGGDLPGRVHHFVAKQKEWALWDQEEREKQWQALTDDLNTRLVDIRQKMKKTEATDEVKMRDDALQLATTPKARSASLVATEGQKRELELVKKQVETEALKQELELAYADPLRTVFQSSQVQLFVGIIASLIQILLLKVFVVGT